MRIRDEGGRTAMNRMLFAPHSAGLRGAIACAAFIVLFALRYWRTNRIWDPRGIGTHLQRWRELTIYWTLVRGDSVIATTVSVVGSSLRILS
jgi:hypothetical protein